MAATFKKILDTTMSGSTFTASSIPDTYDDLVIYASCRTNNSSYQYIPYIQINFNGNYSSQYVFSFGYATRYSSTQNVYPESSYNSTSTMFYMRGAAPSVATTGAHMTLELYIPQYATSNWKSAIGKSGFIDPSQSFNITSQISVVGASWLNTSAITSISLAPVSTTFQSTSSIQIYGISKS